MQGSTARLAGKVAIITGATGGIGARTAQRLVAEGARVVLAGRRAAAGEALAARLGEATSFVRTDVTVEDDVRRLVAHAVERFGRIDCLFNNAGALSPGAEVARLALGDLDAAFALHVRGALAGIKHVAPVMQRQRAGSIINMASIAGITAGIAGVAYSTAKAGVRQLSRCAAIELGEHGIRVNSVSPGPVVTAIFGRALGLDAGAAEQAAERVRAALERYLPEVQPLPGAGSADDVAHAVVFLASDESRFVTGHDLVIDGGSMAGRPAAVLRAQRARLAAALAPGGPKSANEH